jgi:hypothetical protein
MFDKRKLKAKIEHVSRGFWGLFAAGYPHWFLDG